MLMFLCYLSGVYAWKSIPGIGNLKLELHQAVVFEPFLITV